MSSFKQLLRALLATIIFALPGWPAYAVCEILSISSVTPTSVNTGSYSVPAVPVAQPLDITVEGIYLGVGGGQCQGSVAFNRASLPASMSVLGGGSATLPYTLQDAPSGGNTLLYTGAGVPSPANRLPFSFPGGFLGIPVTFAVQLTVYALAQPAPVQMAGAYSDTITLDVFGQPLSLPLKLRSVAFAVTGTINKGCTIEGMAQSGADAAAIDVSAGMVDTSPIVRSYANVACNTPSNVQLTSQNGAVRTPAAPIAGFSNAIDYSASASFSGATAILNTATQPGASASETGTSVPTSGATPGGALSVIITPHANFQPLLVGTYQDTLTITITPQ